MIRILTLAAAATLLPAAAHALSPCSLLTPAQIKAVLNAPVTPGQPGGATDAPDCTWRDAQGNIRVYLSLKDAAGFHALRLQMQATGNLLPITGVGEDAFFISSAAGSSAALYTLKKKHLLLLTVDGPGFAKGQNEAAEKALATAALAHL